MKKQQIKLYERCSIFSEYKSDDEIIYDFTVLRMDYLRNVLKIYDLSKKIEVNKELIAQVRVNLANLYLETGRIVESIEELENCKFTLGMALGNYAAKLYQLSTYVLDKTEQKELLIHAKYYYSMLSKNGSNDPWMPKDIYESFKQAETYVSLVLEDCFSDTVVFKDLEASDLKEFDIKENQYRLWCRENQLALSVDNIYQKKSLGDDIHLPNFGIGYFAEDNTLTYYSWFNTLKQEFNLARYNLYITDHYTSYCDVHESQENILLINTLDYPAVGYHTELLKSSLKTAYGVLDKIGMFSHCFVEGKNKEIRRVDFYSWYKGIENEIALHSGFSALHWMARDLDHKDGSYKTYRLLRNVIEHRYLRVLDNYGVPLDVELQDKNKMEYKISYSNLREQVVFVLKYIRAALFYLVFALNICYLNSMNECEEENKIFIPLGLSFYDDEWKN
jgi:hypothetical protein